MDDQPHQIQQDENTTSTLQTSSTPREEEEWPLHRACWLGDYKRAKFLVDPQNPGHVPDINERDHRGNPALHIAIHLRHYKIVRHLLKSGADPTFKNGGGWNPLQEAVASADRKTATLVFKATQRALQQKFNDKVPELNEALRKLPDFYMEIQWEFKSWVPLVTKVCPDDKYRIWKKGSLLRADSTLLEFQNYRWVRANLSIHFTGTDSDQPGQVLLLNHDRKTIDYFNSRSKSDEAIQRDVRLVFCRTLIRVDLRTDDVIFSPSKTWFGYHKSELVGRWDSLCYNLSNLEYVSQHRTDSTKAKHQPRQPRTEAPELAFEEYFSPVPENGYESSKKGKGLLYPSEKFREKTRTFKGAVWLAQDFPLQIEDLLPVIEILSPSCKHFDRLRSFIKKKLPQAGFPTKLEIPVMPTINGTVTFLMFEERNDISDELFCIPTDYVVVV